MSNQPEPPSELDMVQDAAALTWSVWRLVDLLVQLSLEREYDYEPFVTADEFLTCAEEHFDLDNPPPAPAVGAV